MELKFVIDQIRTFAGVRYDPTVVAAFIRAWEKGDLMAIAVAPQGLEDEVLLREAF
jgi:response regulator RpfG family c-di-GMP phosphodiesterase